MNSYDDDVRKWMRQGPSPEANAYSNPPPAPGTAPPPVGIQQRANASFGNFDTNGRSRLIQNSKLGKAGQVAGVAQAGLGVAEAINNDNLVPGTIAHPVNANAVDNIAQGAAMAVNPGIGAIGNLLTQGRDLAMESIIGRAYRDNTAGPELTKVLNGLTPAEYLAKRNQVAPAPAAAPPVTAPAPAAETPPAATLPVPQDMSAQLPQAPPQRMLAAPAPITDIATNYQNASTPLGQLWGSTIARGGISQMNNMQQRAFGNTLKAEESNREAAQLPGKIAGEGAKTQNLIANTAAQRLDTQVKQKLADLHAQIDAEKDPTKLAALQQKMMTLMGKNPYQDRYHPLDIDTGLKDPIGQPIFKKGIYDAQLQKLIGGDASPAAANTFKTADEALAAVKTGSMTREQFKDAVAKLPATEQAKIKR